MIYGHTTSAKRQAAQTVNRNAWNKAHRGQEEIGWEALACAIVKQAVDDYRYAEAILNGEHKVSEAAYANRYASRAEVVKADIVKFFRGQWYGVLCDIPGERILKHLGVKA